jgi:hypothetical protein
MKKVLALLVLSMASIAFAAEVKEVCEDVKDKKGQVVKDKDGKVKQSCKTIKVHKKLEGTKVPEKK